MSPFAWHNQPSELAQSLRREGLKKDASRRAARKLITTPKKLGKNVLAPIDYGRQVNAFTRA